MIRAQDSSLLAVKSGWPLTVQHGTMQQSSTENTVQLELEYVCTSARYTVQFSAACSAGPFASYSASCTTHTTQTHT